MENDTNYFFEGYKDGESKNYWENKNKQKSILVSFFWFIVFVFCFVGASWNIICPFLDLVK